MKPIGSRHFRSGRAGASFVLDRTEETLMADDIDWANASSDCGLIALCREMEALAAPLRSAASMLRRGRAQERLGKRPQLRLPTRATAALNA
jgi:hypothetical protein